MTKPLEDLQAKALLTLLKNRFVKNTKLHPSLQWKLLEKKLLASASVLWSLNAMEQTGGEPDVIAFNPQTHTYLFVDCSPESPKGRRSLCYDAAALNSRPTFKPQDSAVNLAQHMGVTLLSFEQYQLLQSLGAFDAKTSSWILTPKPIRDLGGACFCDRRYNHVFMYHNGAESYYAARGFRAALTV